MFRSLDARAVCFSSCSQETIGPPCERALLEREAFRIIGITQGGHSRPVGFPQFMRVGFAEVLFSIRYDDTIRFLHFR